MRRSPLRLQILVVAVLVAGCAAPVPPRPSVAVSAQRERFEKIFFGSSEASSPNVIARRDDNERILELCVAGLTEAELRARGVTPAASQLAILSRYGLLARDGARLRTTIPVLDARRTALVRALARHSAAQAIPLLRADLDALRAALRRLGRERATFTFLFSCALDALVWERFAVRDRLASAAAPKDAPPRPWRGLFWMVTPPRPSLCGTNSASHGDTTLYLSWSEAARPRLRPILSSWARFERLAAELAERGRVTSPDLIAFFLRYGVVDGDGRPRIAVVEATSRDAVFAASTRLAETVSTHVLRSVDLERIRRETGLPGRSESLVVTYHEWMWELLDELVRRRIVERPTVFSAPAAARDPQVGDLLFLVRQPRVQLPRDTPRVRDGSPRP